MINILFSVKEGSKHWLCEKHEPVRECEHMTSYRGSNDLRNRNGTYITWSFYIVGKVKANLAFVIYIVVFICHTGMFRLPVHATWFGAV